MPSPCSLHALLMSYSVPVKPKTNLGGPSMKSCMRKMMIVTG